MNVEAHKDDCPIVHFTRGQHRFEIYRSRSERGVRYVGYFDGHLSVTAAETHLVTKMLLLRHAARSSQLLTPPLQPLNVPVQGILDR